MPRLPAKVLGDAYTSTVGWEVLTDLVDIGNRMAGHGGEAAAADLLAEALGSYARDVEVSEFDVRGWHRGPSSLIHEQSDGRTQKYDSDTAIIALPGTPAGAVEADLVDVGHGTPEEFAEVDLSGKVAMASSASPPGHDRWIHRMEKYVNALENGAEAFVFRNHVEGSLPPTGEVGYHERPAQIPAVGVSAELGARLARHAKGDSTVRIDIDCQNEPAVSRNVEGVVGPDTDREVLVSAHLDAHDISEGAADNGFGCALVVEIGRLLSRVADDLDTRVRLVTFGAEEMGLWGADHWVEHNDHDDVKCVLNLDGLSDSADLWLGTNGFESFEPVFEAVADDLDMSLTIDETVTRNSDHWEFVEEGIPGVMASSTSENDGRGWGHTHADTLDKLDVRNARALAIAYAEAVIRLTDDDFVVDHRSRAESRDALADGDVRVLKAAGQWSYDE